MDIQKEREAFQKEMLDSKYVAGNISAFWDENSQNYDIAINELRMAWHAWQAAKAQAVPDTYTPIVLALEDVQSKIAKASFLTMDADNENEVYAVDANELAGYIEELIEAQELAND